MYPQEISNSWRNIYPISIEGGEHSWGALSLSIHPEVQVSCSKMSCSLLFQVDYSQSCLNKIVMLTEQYEKHAWGQFAVEN